MVRAAITVGLALLVASPAQASYSGISGGAANPSSIASAGATDYSISLTGRPRPVDIVFVIDASGSMATNMPNESVTRSHAAAAATNSEINALSNASLFARGGTMAVVSFADSAATGQAPTTDVSALTQAVNNIAPGGSGCLSCGIQRATDLLTAIPGASGHKRIVYVLGDGNDNVAPSNVATSTAASNAAHIERRAIGVAPGPITDLDSTDSTGTATYAGTSAAIQSAYTADPTSYPGATNLSWVFHLVPGFSASAPTTSTGTATVNAGDVTWTIPNLDSTTATLTFHTAHDAAAGCSATTLLSSTSFNDSEGDAAPSAGLGQLTITGCPPATSPPPTTPIVTPTPPQPLPPVPATALTLTKVTAHGSSIGSRHGVTLSLVLSRAGTVNLRFARRLTGRSVHGRCVAQTKNNRRQKSCSQFSAAGTLTRTLAAGRQQIALTKRLNGARKLSPGTYRVLVLAAGAANPAKTLTLTVQR